MQGYRKAVEKDLNEYADFFVKEMQQLQNANAATFYYFSSKKDTLSLNQGYADDASLRPGPPQPGINDEIKSVINSWYSVLLYAQSARFDREPYARAVEAVARILRDLGSFDEGSWTILVSAYNKAVEFEGDHGTITQYLYNAIQALYNVNPATQAHTMSLVGTILPAEASPPASEVAEEDDEEDFDSDEDERHITEEQLPELQPPESMQYTDSEEGSEEEGGALSSQTQRQS